MPRLAYPPLNPLPYKCHAAKLTVLRFDLPTIPEPPKMRTLRAHAFYIYIYIYIYMCVCACMCYLHVTLISICGYLRIQQLRRSSSAEMSMLTIIICSRGPACRIFLRAHSQTRCPLKASRSTWHDQGSTRKKTAQESSIHLPATLRRQVASTPRTHFQRREPPQPIRAHVESRCSRLFPARIRFKRPSPVRKGENPRGPKG